VSGQVWPSPPLSPSRGAALSLLALIVACSDGASTPDVGGTAADAGAADVGARDVGPSDADTPDLGAADAAVDAGVDGGARDTGPDAGSLLDPALATPGRWTWIPIPGSTCRDGSPTGIGVKLRPGATRLFVYLEAGGACFNAETCRTNAARFGADEFAVFARGAGNAALFSDDAANPLATWHQIYVPYCTGDVHGGTRTGVDVPGGPAQQQFVGHQNVERAVLVLRGALGAAFDQVLLGGSSAGSFGTFINYATVADAFDASPVFQLADSGPVVRDDAALSPCLEQLWATLWGLDDAVPADCAECRAGASGQGFDALPAFHARRYPRGRFALIAGEGDQILRQFWGFGRNACMRYEPVPADVFRAALRDQRDAVLVPSGVWSTFFVPSEGHVFLRDPEIRTTSVDGTSLVSFLASVLRGDIVQVAAP
jgi:hypothetical protein